MRSRTKTEARTCVYGCLILFGAGLSSLVAVEAIEPNTQNRGSTEEVSNTPIPQERPRLFQPTNLHPYATPGAVYLDPWFYRGRHFPYYAYDTYGYGGWGRHGYPLGFGYRSHLYYDTFYGMMPAPGQTELSVSIGSDDYFGSSISTTQYLSKKHNIVLNVAALWETGEQWWNGQDYESFTIAPTLYWSNENTLIYVGLQYSERNYVNAASSYATSDSATKIQRPQLSSHDSDSSMSPFSDQIASKRDASNDLRPGFTWRTDTDHTVKSATIGIDHQITDSFRIGLNFETRDFDRKRN